jgi:hypothetical protein
LHHLAVWTILIGNAVWAILIGNAVWAIMFAMHHIITLQDKREIIDKYFGHIYQILFWLVDDAAHTA